jgi:HK97 family phage major capsid protein
MGTTAALIRDLHDKRVRAVEGMRSVYTAAEHRQKGVLSGEQTRQVEQWDAEAESLGHRIDELIQIEKTNVETDEQRERFEKIVRPDGFERSRDNDFPNGIVAAALAGEGPRSFYADFRNLKHSFEADGRLKIESWDLGVGVPNATTAGGYTVPQDFLEELFTHLVEATGVRAAGSRQITTTDGRSLPVPKTTSHGSAALVAEGGTIAENDPAFGQATLSAYKFGQLIQISTELAQDTGISLDSYLAESAGRNLGLASGGYFVTGTNSAQPDGVAIAPVVGKTGASGQTLSVIADDLVDVFHSIVTGYRANGTWLMRDGTVASIRKIKTGITNDTTYVWQPGLTAGAPDTILGRPVITDPNMPAMAANAYSILFGDFSKHYVIRDVVGVRFERSDDYAFGNDLITYRALLRTDGERVDLNAVKAYRNSAT